MVKLPLIRIWRYTALAFFGLTNTVPLASDLTTPSLADIQLTFVHKKTKDNSQPLLTLRPKGKEGKYLRKTPKPENLKPARELIMNNKQLNETSKFLSCILRHEPHAIGLQLDAEGWADINSLILGAAKNGHTLDFIIIKTVVNTSDKKRFTLSEDGQRIRAAQGHSTSSVDLQHQEKEPPEFLYHGTATRFLGSIFQHGLIAGSRHHVHLSQDTLTAITVGRRYGKPVILKIKSLHMYQQGFKFFQAENNVWLTEGVPIEFISNQDASPES